MARKTEVEKTLDVVEIVNKRFGSVLMRLGDRSIPEVDVVASGSIGLDKALGVGGLPRGRVVEVYGAAAAGKTTLTLHVIANAQRKGLECAFIDAEHALDVGYARNLGVDTSALLVSQPDYGEQALDVLLALCGTGRVGVVVVDSVAALTPKAEIDGDMGDHHVGAHARLMSQAMRKLTHVCSSSKTLVVFINQTRAIIGGMQFGPKTTTTGGHALRFYASVRLSVSRLGSLKTADVEVGSRTRVKVVKNKLAPPFQEVDFDIDFGRGISREGELVDMAVERGLVDKNGAFYSFGDDKIGQGREQAKAYLRDNPSTADAIHEMIRRL
jgi:recombination protein RecA